MRCFIKVICFAAVFNITNVFAQSQNEELKSTFEKFIAVQNSHDAKALDSLLSDSSNFLWITRGEAVWGREEAIKRFKNLYLGTWHLEPDVNEFRITLAEGNVAQIFVPILFTIGKQDQPAQKIRFLMNMILVSGETGWKISSLLPIQGQ